MFEDRWVGDILCVGQLSRGKVHSADLKEGDILLSMAIHGGVVDDIDESVDNFAEARLRASHGAPEEASRTATHNRRRDGVKVIFSDKTKVVAATPQSPIQVRERGFTCGNNQTISSDDLQPVSNLLVGK